jgi:energy-coupling factor transporter ATP-binding protein EcfA2
MPEPNLLDIDGLTVRYRGAARDALREVRLTVSPGELVAVTGASGAGKSTLCRCIGRVVPTFHPADLRGRMRLNGESLAGKAVHDLVPEVGLVFQDFETQLFATEVWLEVAFGLENLGLPRAEILRRVTATLARIGLTGLERREPATLSGGQKQRLALAAVLAMEPRLLVMDEPTTDLDPAGRAEVLSLAEARRAQDAGILLVDHDPDDLIGAERLLVLHDGAIALEGPARALLQRPAQLAALGVRPPQVPAFFEHFGLTDLPVTVADGLTCLREGGWRITPRPTPTTPPIADPILEARGVSYRYPGGVEALVDLNLAVRPGEILAILGQNGCGKSTLARLLTGLLAPSAGEIRVRGQSVAGRELAGMARHVGYVFQNPDHQLFAQTVREEVIFGPRNFGVPAAEWPDRLRHTLAAVDLTGRENDNPFTMAKGERQRVAVASVLAAAPEVIILDEPTTGLDYRQQVAMLELVRRLQAAGHTILLITHAMWVAAAYAHRCVLMAEGRIFADGPPQTVFADDSALARAHLRPPAIAALSGALGCPVATVDDLLSCVTREVRR